MWQFGVGIGLLGTLVIVLLIVLVYVWFMYVGTRSQLHEAWAQLRQLEERVDPLTELRERTIEAYHACLIRMYTEISDTLSANEWSTTNGPTGATGPTDSDAYTLRVLGCGTPREPNRAGDGWGDSEE